MLPPKSSNPQIFEILKFSNPQILKCKRFIIYMARMR